MEKHYHLWTIVDAKDGDVLHSPTHNLIWIHKDIQHYHACVNMNYVKENFFTDGFIVIPTDVCPATKDEQTILFAKIHEAGYMWNSESKQLLSLKAEPSGELIPAELAKGEDYGIDGLWHAQRILEKTFGKVDGYQTDDGILSHECAISAVKELYEKKPAWSEEDKKEYKYVLKLVDNILNNCGNKKDYEHYKRCYDWLKSLKERINV